MIDAWYFCSSVQVGPTAVAAYLAVLRAIRSRQADPGVVATALAELARAEPALRYYALPDVLATGLRDARTDLRVADGVRKLLGTAVATIDPEVGRAIVMAWNAMHADGPADDALVPLVEAMRRSREIQREQPPEATPYVQVEDHVAEIILLALCAQAGQRDGTLAQELADHIETGTLIKQALGNRAGRLGLLLGAQAAMSLLAYLPDPPPVTEALLNPEHGAALWEPDMLGALARCAFGYPGERLRPRRQALRSVLEEMVLFSHLSRWERSRSEPTTAARAAVSRLGLGAIPGDQDGPPRNSADTLRLVLWQAVLWQLAVDLDAMEAATALAEHWLAPYQELSGTIHVSVPLPDRVTKSWIRKIEALAQLRLTAAARHELSVRSGSQLTVPSSLAVLALSPWLSRSPRRAYEIHRDHDALVLFRLMTAGLCSLQMMDGEASQGPPEHLLGLALHAWEVLGKHRWINDLSLASGGRVETEPSMSLPLSGLAVFLWRELKRMGGGENDHVSPAAITAYLLPDRPDDLSKAELEIRAQALGQSFDFVFDGLSGSVPGETTGQGRWRQVASVPGPSYAEQILRRLASSANAFNANRVRSLLRVFLGADPMAPTLSKILRDYKRPPTTWLVLAARRLDDAELSSPELTEALAAADRGEVRDATLPLAVATARLDAVLAGQVAVNDQTAAAWLDEWSHKLAAVSDRKQFPRALRWFMLELLALPLSGDGNQLRAMEELIDAEVEFGLGTPFDRWMLFNRLRPDATLRSEFAHSLRLRMLRELYFLRTRSPLLTDIRDPSSVSRTTASDAFLDRLLTRFIVDTGTTRGELQSASVATIVPELWKETRKAPDLRELRADLGGAASGSSLDDLDRHLLVGAVIDPMTEYVRLHLRRRPVMRTGADRSLGSDWGRHADELRERISGRAESTVLGVVAAVLPDCTWVNIGLNQPLRWALPLEGAVIGELVAVTVQPRAGGLMIRERGGIEHLPTEPLADEIRMATVVIDQRRMPASVTVRLPGEALPFDESTPEWACRQWLPDLVSLLADGFAAAGPDSGLGKAEGTLALTGIARREGDTWVPADQGQGELFAHLAGLDGDRAVRLVLVGSVGATEARYSIAPGYNFKLPHEIWIHRDRDEIEGTLRSLGSDALGLVVYARVCRDEDGTPRLARHEGRDIDDRARQWRHVFDDTEFEAARDLASGQLAMGHDIPGFPPITVAVNSSEAICRFSPKRWSHLEQRRATVTGKLSLHRELEVGKPSIDKLLRLLDMQEGETVELGNVLLDAPARAGLMLGWTREGLSVDVEADSLHFGVLGTDPKSAAPFVRGRQAVVTSVYQPRERDAARAPGGISARQIIESVDEAERSAVSDHLLRASTLDGIVVDAPTRRSGDEDLFKVWLNAGGIVAAIRVRRSDFQHSPERAGIMVRAQRMNQNSWSLIPYKRSIQVRPLWRLVDGGQLPPKSIFLGVIRWEGALRMLCQLPQEGSHDGRPMLPALHMAPLPSVLPAHFAERDDTQDSWRKPQFDLAHGRLEVSNRGRGQRRAVITIDRGKRGPLQFAGEVKGSGAVTDARVESVDMRVTLLPSGAMQAWRVFSLTEQGYRRDEPIRGTAQVQDESAGWREYQAGSRPSLPAKRDPENAYVTLQTGWKVPLNGRWTFRVPLVADEEPWVDHRNTYQDGDIQVVLKQEADGGLVASYRDVPPLDLTEAAELFKRQGMTPGETWNPRQPIYYVDRRETPTGTFHRFEWGYGYTFRVAEDRMKVSGREVKAVTPFHGDPLLNLRISATGGSGGPLLEVTVDMARLSSLSQLWADQQDGFVTTAELTSTPDGSGIAVAAVLLRRQRDTEAAGVSHNARRVVIKRLRLSDDAVKVLRPLWEALGTAGADRTQQALMRLNPKSFLSSGGRQARLDFVRPELGVENGIQENWMVFLEAGMIDRLPNDVHLILSSGDLLGTENGFTVRVRRRDYSQREDLLSQLYLSDLRQGEDETKHRSRAVAGDAYLVRLKGLDPARRQASGQIKDGLNRPVSSLRGHVLASGAPCLASAQRDKGGYRIELRPNVSFRLSDDEIASRKGVGDRAIVQIEVERGGTARNGRLILRPVLWGDSEFVPDTGRPAVLLPMQNLVREADALDEALDKDHYVVAGLPSFVIPALPRGRYSGTLPTARDFARSLLTTRHPKIAMVYRDRPTGQLDRPQNRYGPPDGSVRAGILVLADDDTVRVRTPDRQETRIPWSRVSFADVGASVLRDWCERRGWRYHDFMTTYRSQSPPHKPVKPRPLPTKPRATGEVVFFSDDGTGWSLRHPNPQLRSFGFPASELLEGGSGARPQQNSRGTQYTVAGVSWRSAQPQGLWIEKAPGHLIEVPGALLTTNDATRLPLTGVDWTHFAAGDRLQMEVHRGHQLEIGSMGLCDWIPGPRGAFGPRTLLPITAINTRHESMTLGFGTSALSYPMEPDDQPRIGEHAWLSADNSLVIAPAPAAELRRDDVVLLTVKDGASSLVGLPELATELSMSQEHLLPWMREALTGPDAEVLMKMTGGALPVTVDDVRDGRVVVSRRKQRDGHLPPGTSIPVSPLGILAGQVILQAGGRLHRCRLGTLVPGMPAQAGPWAAEKLRTSAPGLLWLTAGGGQPHIGLTDPSRRKQEETRATLLAVFTDEDWPGVLCWDADERRPCWLPASAVGWMTPTEEELRRWVGDEAPPREVSLSLRRNGTLSVIHTAANRQRLEQLRVGHPVRVELLDLPGTQTSDGRLRFPGRVYLSEVLVNVLIDSDGPPPDPGLPRFCEVERRRGIGGTRVEVSVCDLGARRLWMALPPRAIIRGAAFSGDSGTSDPRPDSLLDSGSADSHIVAIGQRAIDDGTNLVRDGDLSSAAHSWLVVRGDLLFGRAARQPVDVVPTLSAALALTRLCLELEGTPLGKAAGQAAVHICRQLGLRAALSRHLEPMLDRWPNPENVSFHGELWRRLDEIALADHIGESAIERIHAVDNGIRGRTSVRPDQDLTLVSACIAASVGAHHDFDDIDRYPSVARELNALGRALVPRTTELVSQDRLIPAQLDLIARLLRTTMTGNRLTLLGIPEILQDPCHSTLAPNFLRDLMDLLAEQNPGARGA
jgi:hypothetical protein